jgi:hypothetical protein
MTDVLRLHLKVLTEQQGCAMSEHPASFALRCGFEGLVQ